MVDVLCGDACVVSLLGWFDFGGISAGDLWVGLLVVLWLLDWLAGWGWWLHGGCVVLVVADWIGCLCVYLAWWCCI